LRYYSRRHAGEGSHRPPTRAGVSGSAPVDSEGLTIRRVRPSSAFGLNPPSAGRKTPAPSSRRCASACLDLRLRPATDFLITIPADRSEIAQARTALAQWLRAALVDAAVLDDLVVVASELLANAIDASPGDATVALRGNHSAGTVTLEAINQVSDWVSPAERWDLDDPLRTGGRGLLIVSALADHIEAEHDIINLCTVVRVRRNLESTQRHDEVDQAQIADLEPGLRL